MKYFAGLLSTFISLYAFAFTGESGRMDCTPDPNLPSYQLFRKDLNTFQMRAHFPNGISSAPVYSGDVSLADIGWLTRKAEYVKLLGATYSADIPVAQCIRKKHDNAIYYVHCFSKTPMNFNGVAIEGISFHASGTSVQSLSLANGKYQVVTDEQSTVGVDIGMKTGLGIHWHDLSRTFLTSECKINDDFWN